jgi:C4-dicarboxylate transporter DctM subunit
MKRRGWKPQYIATLLACAGPLGYMIPPNTNAIMYAVIANGSVGALFLSTVVPGVIWGALLMIVNRFLYKRYYEPEKAVPELREAAINEGKWLPGETLGSMMKELGGSFVGTIPALLMPAIIFGGIYGGVFTATEAGAVSALYAILLGVFLKTMKARDIWGSFTETGMQMGVILFITPMAMIFTRVLVVNGAPQAIADFFLSLSDSRVVVLLLIDLVFVLAGFFVGPTVIIFVVTPLLMPAATLMGIDYLQMGVMLFVAIGVGNITPPMAMNVFIASKVTKVDVGPMLVPVYYYFFLTGIPMMLLVTFVPFLSTWLPGLIY